jgi:hypothetical protein
VRTRRTQRVSNREGARREDCTRALGISHFRRLLAFHEVASLESARLGTLCTPQFTDRPMALRLSAVVLVIPLVDTDLLVGIGRLR